jgi:hypothetical protein
MSDMIPTYELLETNLCTVARLASREVEIPDPTGWPARTAGPHTYYVRRTRRISRNNISGRDDGPTVYTRTEYVPDHIGGYWQGALRRP